MSRPPSDPSGPTGLLATWIADLELDSIPEPVIDRAKHLLLDGIGCALIGAQLPWSRVAVDAVLALEGDGGSPIIGWGRTTSPSAAALLNSTFIQGFELDDFHPLAPLHSASLVIPALLAAPSGPVPVSGASFVTAAVAGFEVGPRVGLALHGSEMLSRGWHTGPVFGTHAAAAAVGHLLGLDAGAMEDALGLAATQSGGLMAAQFGAMSKRMQTGSPPATGCSPPCWPEVVIPASNRSTSNHMAASSRHSAKGTTRMHHRSRPNSVTGGRRSASSSSPTPPWAACMRP